LAIACATSRDGAGRIVNRVPALVAHGPHARPRAVPPRRVGLRGEGGRLAQPRLQDGRARSPRQPARRRSHEALADIAAAITKLSARTLVLDGELALYDHQLTSRFEWRRDLSCIAG
jgi:hypothetical protein